MAVDWNAKREEINARWREADRKFWRGIVIMDAGNGMDWQNMSVTMHDAKDRVLATRKAIVTALYIVTVEALHGV